MSKEKTTLYDEGDERGRRGTITSVNLNKNLDAKYVSVWILSSEDITADNAQSV